MVAVRDDGHRAREWAKQQIAFYGTTPNYHGVVASYGDENLTDELRSVFRHSPEDVEALRAAVPGAAVQEPMHVGASPAGVGSARADPPA